MTTTLVSLRERPDLVPTIASWLWYEWARLKGRTLEQVEVRLTGRLTTAGFEETFVCLVQDTPVGTASLVDADLDTRPDLTPWLAGVFVAPEYRGKNLAPPLVRRVEDAAQAAGARTLWLHTEHAEGLYAKLGWEAVGPEMDHQVAVTLMKRLFDQPFKTRPAP
jgi:GNAT superfamily N-acetyltransferase